MSEAKKKSIPADTVELASRVKDNLAYADGKITDKPEQSAYAATLPSNLTMEIIGAVDKHNSDFVHASTLAAGQMAVEAMAKDNTLKQVEASIQFGTRSRIEASVNREAVSKVPNPNGGTTDHVVKGGMTVGIHVPSYDRNNSVMKTIRQEIRDEASGKW